jgi:tetratricopeptide (TPR) repeat protein
MILRNLALAYVDTGDFESAERSAKRAFSIIASKFGPSEPGLTPILNVLAECYASSGRIGEAQRMSEQAISIGASAGAHYGIALHNLGAIRELSGDPEGAASLYRKAITAKLDALDSAHPSVALSKAALRRVQRHDYRAFRALKLEQLSE